MKNQRIRSLVLAAMLLAVGLILPFFTGQIKEIGNMLLPMHLPVMLCGLICGWKYGAAVGFVLPLLRSVTFGMPALYPNAVAMAFELCTYGLVIGILYGLFPKKNLLAVYGSLIPAMLTGRLIWGIVQTILLGISGKGFSLAAFWTAGFANALLGIVIQLILIPPLALLLGRRTQRKNT
ncbi:MAG: ECF transporter S component [Clostridia bacterium]|nr:ECF transporter S component [Clostridia bacterium]